MSADDSAGRDEPVPISVRLGAVVPPEDPEDWSRPLTWAAAVGLLAAPLATAGWYLVSRPTMAQEAHAGTWLVAAALSGGAALAGATQRGAARAVGGTLAAAVFGALAMIIVGVILAGERQVGVASPTVAHAIAGALAGGVGTLAAASIAFLAARIPSPARRALVAAPFGIATSALVVPLLLRP
jgi:hypothetical protein